LYIHALILNFGFLDFKKEKLRFKNFSERREKFVQNQERNIESNKRDEDFLMTDLEVAELAKVSVNTIRYWRQTGIMPFVKVGRHPRIWSSTFERVFQKPGLSGLVEMKPLSVIGMKNE
jgi:excisionase family DNA binding protein